MAATRALSILPTIKCSNCHVDIELSSMGDHMCAQAPSARQTPAARFNHAFASMNRTDPSDYPSKANRGALAPIDPSIANRPYARPALNGFSDSYHSPQHGSGGSQSLFHAPFRSATYPPQARGPSPELSLPQDCAFPNFPLGQNYTSKDGAESRSSAGEKPPPSSSNSGNGHLLQRMKSITPGPFAQKANGNYQAFRRPHQRTTSQESKDFAIRSSPQKRAPTTQPSTSSFESTARGNLYASRTGMTATWEPEMPSSPSPNHDMQRPGLGSLPNSFTSDARPRAPQSTPDQDAISQGLPPPRNRREISPHSRKASIHRPLDEIGSMSSYRSHHPYTSREGQTSPTKVLPRSTIANEMHDEQGTSDNSTLTSARYSSSSQSRSASATGQRDDHRSDRQQDNVPPLPAAASLIKEPHFNPARNAIVGNGVAERKNFEAQHDTQSMWELDFNGSPYHTSTKSVSSNGSSNSDHHTASSRSSPPLSGRLFDYRMQDSEGYHNPPLPDNIHESIVHDTLVSGRGGRAKSFSRPTHAGRGTDQPLPGPLMDSGLDGSRFRGRRPSMDDRESSRPIPISKDPFYESASDLGLPPARSYDSALSTPRPGGSDSSRRRPAAGHKGNCRGCGQVIIGKSVSSADGRLTGRYHKQCFVCTTCREPFATNDFYVINNSPLCARHYHQQNGTMCSSCDRGIEGQYLETESRQKFHPHCFACRECHLILRDDYYEAPDGSCLCERHALRPDNLGPGRRHPERRTTRLMMM